MSQRRPRGALKGEILAQLLAAEGPRTAKELRTGFAAGDAPPLATVLTVLERLRRSGEVARETTPGGELGFRAVRDGSHSTAEAMLADLLRTQDRTSALLRFAGRLDEQDAQVLRRAGRTRVVTALAGALFAWAVLGVVAAPRLVADRAWPIRLPRLALAVWSLLGLTVVAGALTGLGLLLLSVQQLASSGPAADLSTCQACQDLAVFGAGWVATIVVGGLGALALCRGLGMSLERREVRRLTRAVAGSAAGRVVYLDTDQHVAACDHRRGPVVVSTALRDLLSATELDTVIEHERSHLRQRHQLVASAARLQRACLPRLAGAHACERSVLLLVELAADDSAARRCGRDLTARTLTKVGRASADPAMQLRARRLQSA